MLIVHISLETPAENESIHSRHVLFRFLCKCLSTASSIPHSYHLLSHRNSHISGDNALAFLENVDQPLWLPVKLQRCRQLLIYRKCYLSWWREYPNTSAIYQEALKILYGLSFTIKTNSTQPEFVTEAVFEKARQTLAKKAGT